MSGGKCRHGIGPGCSECASEEVSGTDGHSKPIHSTPAPDYFQRSLQVAESILGYFDNYRLGSMAPIAAEIEKAMEAAYKEGLKHETLAKPAPTENMISWKL